MPTAEHFDGVWKLGARYSRYEYADRRTKLRACGLHVVDNPDLPGPILQDGVGWIACSSVGQPDFDGDHGLFIGKVSHVEFNPDHMTSDGNAAGTLRPLMQVTGNRFTTTGEVTRVPYGPA